MRDKQQQRERYRQKLENQPANERTEKSHTIIKRLLSSSEYQQAGTIFCYIATALEVDTSPLLQQILADGKTLAVPRIEGDTIIPKQVTDLNALLPGPYDILQPAAESPNANEQDIDLVIVPGLAFTGKGARLGHGGGYFDRWLATLPAATITVGLAFDIQLAKELPQEAHDIRLTKIVTESQP
ncbi:MAG TPA: 5-formyltetrahydrofolate cyclo-ligase [Candidatus Polarisedimenticolaceae bacterium]|nr:5-formyltetrahydrofolate cyclo-ligase [Candidatus Polarisedimenticolaceae bacterium]